MTKLVDGPSIPYSPDAARALGKGGVYQAALLQQLHFRLGQATKHYDGHWWVFNSYATWGDQLGFTGRQVRDYLGKLRARGFIISRSNPTDPRDQKLWWRLDYDAWNHFAATVGLPATLPNTPGGRRDGQRPRRTRQGTVTNSSGYRDELVRDRDETGSALPLEDKEKTPLNDTPDAPLAREDRFAALRTMRR